MTHADAPIWITEAEAVSLIDLGESISATHQMFAAQGSDGAKSLPKTQAKVGAATIHSIGGAANEPPLVGVKSWVHTPNGAMPMMLLWSLDDGSLLAVVEAHALGQYRTAAVSAVATDQLAPADAASMAILGTGAQALIQVAAVNAVRPLDRLAVWSPREESRAAMVERVENALQIKCTAFTSAEDAVADAEIITLITRATEPFLAAKAPSNGTHLNALGAIGPDRCEFEPALIGRCALVAIDDIDSARSSSTELRDYFGEAGPWTGLRTLAEVVARNVARPAGADLTLFKGMGTGIADLGIARFIYEQARENGLGQPLPIPARSKPRLRASMNRAAVGYV